MFQFSSEPLAVTVCVFSGSVVSNSLQPYGLYPTRICPWNSPVKNIRGDCHSLLQGIFPSQELNPCLLHHRQIFSCLSHQEALGITYQRLRWNFVHLVNQLLLLLLLSHCSHVRLCDPIDGSPPGSPVPGILQARTLERVAISFSSAWKWKVKVKSPSRVRLLATSWTVAYQAPLSMGFSRQEYWSGVPLPSPIN